MTTGVQRFCALSGPLFAVTLFVGMLMTGLFPPTSPGWSAQHVAEFWSTHTQVRQAGLALMLAGCGLQIPFGSLLAVRLKKIEGRWSPFTYMLLMSAALSVVAIILPVFFFAAASFRPERSPEITQALNDLGWLPFVMNWPAATAMALAFGFGVLADRARTPLFPRWSGYANLWAGFLFVAGGFVVFFKHGVFAWNGLLAFWMVAVFFGAWFFLLAYLLWTTIDAQSSPEAEPAVEAVR